MRRQYLNCYWTSTLKMTFHFYKNLGIFLALTKCLFFYLYFYKVLEIVVVPNCFASCFYLFVFMLIPRYQKITFFLVTFRVVTKGQEKGVHSYKHLLTFLQKAVASAIVRTFSSLRTKRTGLKCGRESMANR